MITLAIVETWWNLWDLCNSSLRHQKLTAKIMIGFMVDSFFGETNQKLLNVVIDRSEGHWQTLVVSLVFSWSFHLLAWCLVLNWLLSSNHLQQETTRHVSSVGSTTTDPNKDHWWRGEENFSTKYIQALGPQVSLKAWEIWRLLILLDGLQLDPKETQLYS